MRPTAGTLYFGARRGFEGDPVDGPHVFDPQHPLHAQRATFVQFLVNRRTEQAYAREDGDDAKADEIGRWFEALEEQISDLAGEALKLRFTRSPKFAYSILHEDGRESPFEHLPAGYGNVLEVLSRSVMMLEEAGCNPADSCILLIDEPEVHLHPRLQLRLLPTLARLVPGAQIIAATHSPLVAASLQDAAVYELETKELVHTYDLDPNASLLRVFGSDLQPDEVRELMRQAADQVDEESTAALETLARLEQILGANHDEVVRLTTLMSLLGGESGASHQ